MDTNGFALLARIHALTDGTATTTPELRAAVATLTAAADPGRADRLAPRPGEPPVLVARLAVWALRRVEADAVEAATAALDGASQREAHDEDRTAALALAC